MIAILALAACTEAEQADPPAELEIIGEWVDDFGSSHTIEADQWSIDTSVFAITQFDNELRFVVAQNDTGNAFNPDQWSRMDWFEDGTFLYYCQTVFDAPTEGAALGATPADLNDRDAGCGGFSWSLLSEN